MHLVITETQVESALCDFDTVYVWVEGFFGPAKGCYVRTDSSELKNKIHTQTLLGFKVAFTGLLQKGDLFLQQASA